MPYASPDPTSIDVRSRLPSWRSADTRPRPTLWKALPDKGTRPGKGNEVFGQVLKLGHRQSGGGSGSRRQLAFSNRRTKFQRPALSARSYRVRALNC